MEKAFCHSVMHSFRLTHTLVRTLKHTHTLELILYGKNMKVSGWVGGERVCAKAKSSSAEFMMS